jgi:SAM-dependent methyltransferase
MVTGQDCTCLVPPASPSDLGGSGDFGGQGRHNGAVSEQQQPVGWSDQERVRWWIAGARQREAQLAPISEELFAVAALRPGEVVVDVGVGTGPTTLDIARVVGPNGRVVGIDIAPAMIETARATTDGVEGIEWLVADAATHDFGVGTFDAVLSRFGVMFFSDPVAGFANLGRATRPGGRLAAAVWQTRDRVPLFDLPYTAAAETLDELGLTYEPVAADENQCSLGSPQRLVEVLEPAGWRDIEVRPTDQSLYVGGPLTVEAALDMAVGVGPIRGLLDGRPAEVVDAVRNRLRPEFAARHDGTGVLVPGGFMIVTARR